MKDSVVLPALSKVFFLRKKNHFLCALLFIFPVAFILINAVIQQVVGELLTLGKIHLLPQQLLLTHSQARVSSSIT